MLNNKSILITGGTGSLGKRLVKLILEKYQPSRLVVFSRDELKQHDMAQEFPLDKHPALRYFLGDVRDRNRLISALHNIEYVIHTAALKQVPAAEYNPFEFVKTNILGAQNLIEAAAHNQVRRIIALSTDKAANPINLYGATKLCSDKLFLAANSYRGADYQYSVVRYGNVLGSRGSAIPLFQKQRATGTVTLTDERMTRFCITLERAAEFVLSSLEIMQGNEIFIPKIPSVRINDLLEAVAPGCRIDKIGIRPGEKLHEMLIARDESRFCYDCGGYYVVKPASPFFKDVSPVAGEKVADDFEYVSNVNRDWLSAEQLRGMLEMK